MNLKANMFFSCLMFYNINQSEKLAIFMFVLGCFCWEENLVTKAGAFATPYPKNVNMYDLIDLKAINSCLKTWWSPGRSLSWLLTALCFWCPSGGVHIVELLQLLPTALEVQASVTLHCACILFWFWYFQIIVAFCSER